MSEIKIEQGAQRLVGANIGHKSIVEVLNNSFQTFEVIKNNLNCSFLTEDLYIYYKDHFFWGKRPIAGHLKSKELTVIDFYPSPYLETKLPIDASTKISEVEAILKDASEKYGENDARILVSWKNSDNFNDFNLKLQKKMVN